VCSGKASILGFPFGFLRVPRSIPSRNSGGGGHISNEYVRHTMTSYVGLARTVCAHTVYDRIFGDVPAKNALYTPYVYGFGQP